MPIVRSIQNHTLLEYIYLDKNFERYPKEKKKIKLANTAPVPKNN